MLRQPIYALFLLLCGLLVGCQAAAAVPEEEAALLVPTIKPTVVVIRPTNAPPMTATTLPSRTPIPTATATPVPTATFTPTPIPICSERVPNEDELLTLMTHQYGIGRQYEPHDMKMLGDYLPRKVTRGREIWLRSEAVVPLQSMVAAMTEAGLEPFVISGYRSYVEQAVAWQKWQRQFPDRADQLSAVPGHSEHQLGTTIDIGSPELPELVGQPGIEFHTFFYKTSEGVWLDQHAPEYGFTLSYPWQAYELTGFYYEPWHFRYVGVELAMQLQEEGITLIEYLLRERGIPCIP